MRTPSRSARRATASRIVASRARRSLRRGRGSKGREKSSSVRTRWSTRSASCSTALMASACAPGILLEGHLGGRADTRDRVANAVGHCARELTDGREPLAPHKPILSLAQALHVARELTERGKARQSVSAWSSEKLREMPQRSGSAFTREPWKTGTHGRGSRIRSIRAEPRWITSGCRHTSMANETIRSECTSCSSRSASSGISSSGNLSQ